MTAPSLARIVLRILGSVLMLALVIDAQAQNRAPISIPPATEFFPPAAAAAATTPPPPMFIGISAAPRAILPTSVNTVRDREGAGIVMFGQLTGSTDSALGVVGAIFTYSQAFDRVPTPLLAAADKSDHAAQVLFAATVHSVAVLGIAVVSLRDSGGDVSVFYDYPDTFAASFPRLQQALAPGGGGAGLAPVHLIDGATINIPPGWRILGQGRRMVDLAGAQGELVTLGDFIPVYAGPTPLAGAVAQGPCCDPLAALQAVFPQIAANGQRRGWPQQTLTGIVASTGTNAPPGGKAAFILATLSVGGRSYFYFGLVEAVGGFTDPWVLHLSAIMAPQPVFAAELPTLLQIWSSFSANPQEFGRRLDEAAQGIEALRAILPSPASATAATVYRADGGWNDVINAVVTHPGTNGSNPVDDATAKNLIERLAKDTGATWHIALSPQH